MSSLDHPSQTGSSNVDQSRSKKSTPNPYHFAENHLSQGLTYNGAIVRKLPVSIDTVTQLKRIRGVSMRSDDIIITAYPKCGTHWVGEMVHMLIRGRAELSTQAKEFHMFEFIEDLALLDQMESPRLLNSHLYLAHLPEQIVHKKVKLVHLIRNPKDCAVSLYHHWRQLQRPNIDQFTFDNFLKGYTTEGYTSMSHQFDFLRQISDFEKAYPDHPILHINYEDLKEDAVHIVQELATFLDIPASPQFCADVASACSFDQLKAAGNSKRLPQCLERRFPRGLKIYRKGVVGDWKNSFTVAQNEMFDTFMARQAEKGQPYNFRWH